MGLERSQIVKTIKKIREKGSEEGREIACCEKNWLQRTQLYKTIQVVKHGK